MTQPIVLAYSATRHLPRRGRALSPGDHGDRGHRASTPPRLHAEAGVTSRHRAPADRCAHRIFRSGVALPWATCAAALYPPVSAPNASCRLTIAHMARAGANSTRMAAPPPATTGALRRLHTRARTEIIAPVQTGLQARKSSVPAGAPAPSTRRGADQSRLWGDDRRRNAHIRRPGRTRLSKGAFARACRSATRRVCRGLPVGVDGRALTRGCHRDPRSSRRHLVVGYPPRTRSSARRSSFEARRQTLLVAHRARKSCSRHASNASRSQSRNLWRSG